MNTFELAVQLQNENLTVQLKHFMLFEVSHDLPFPLGIMRKTHCAGRSRGGIQSPLYNSSPWEGTTWGGLISSGCGEICFVGRSL